MIRARRGIVLLGLLLVGALVACGNAVDEAPDDEVAHDDFAATFRSLVSHYEARVEGLGPEADQRDEDEVIDIYEELLALTVDAREDYAALEPPDDVAPAVERIEETLARQEEALDGVLRAAEDDDVESLERHLRNLQVLIEDWTRTNRLVIQRVDG